MNCCLKYIPTRLHLGDKPIVPKFQVGEKLYYRVCPEKLKRPYDNISLLDISHNRNFCNDQCYPKDDVLININLNDADEVIIGKEIVTLEITNLKNKTTYLKKIISRENESIEAIITLIHSPEACMYSHSAFQISFNNEIVTAYNYKETLGKKNKMLSNLRSEIRQELTLMIQNNIIDSSKGIEYLDEP